MTDTILSQWLNPQFLRTLLLDPDKNKSTCIKIARFVAAYYLDYLLFLPKEEEGLLPSLYLWGNIQKDDLKPTDTILDRTKVSSLLPVEYSPALPALLMVKCDSLIEAISYVDHFDDRRTSLILRLLADSLHNKDLTIDFIKTMIVENLPLQMEESLKSPKSVSKFSQNFTESILQLDVALQDDLVLFMEQHLISSAEFLFSELPWESEELLPNPIYEDPGDTSDSEEAKAFSEIHGYVQLLLESFARTNRLVDQMNFTVKLVTNDTKLPSDISHNYFLHRVLLLMLRITYRHLFSVALRENHPNLGKIAERYKQLLKDESGEHILLQEWFKTAEEDDQERSGVFVDWIQNNYQQVCDVVMSQMLFINSQWTSPGFTFIQPGCLALRLSIHPHDLCLGTTTATVNFSASARDILYSPQEELSKYQEKDEEKIFTPRNHPASPDLISKYAEKHEKMTREMAQTARFFTPFEEQLRVFSRQQDELQRELNKETEFLKRAGHYYYPDPLEDVEVLKAGKESVDPPTKQLVDEALAKQLNLLNERLDEVVKGLADRQKSMYIREEDEESEISDIPLHYEDAPVHDDAPVIEKLDFGMLSSRTPAPIGDLSFKESESEREKYPTFMESGQKTPTLSDNSLKLSTAKSFTNPLFPEKHPKIPIEWMRLLPLEGGSARFADNFLTFTKPKSENMTPRQEDFYKYPDRQIVSERGIGTQTSERMRNGETQMMTRGSYRNEQEVMAENTKKVVNTKSVKKLNEDDMKIVMDRVTKY
ncbi:hypothetical protein GCK72_012909 [Caenorhabditis remanei]|uniref:Uncharacterized protein n=1 Tax=Caenorhabditis remanei TaxID=31234 RepID=A0A6A5GPL1_CAERE|nr:hypothetical protein GCK72_012909 [Caenorhabditis remanei]KAF1756456.1 hypothetical protein GCK72_012909 [Caenorhabditis remanei]